MSKASDALAAIKALLFKKDEPEVTPAQFMTETLPTGETVKWEGDLTVDSVLYVVDGETESVASDGEYVFGNGKVVTVTDGKVSDIKEPEAQTAEENEGTEQVENAAPAEDEPAVDPMVELTDRIAALEAAVAALIEMLTGMTAEYSEMEAKLSELSDAPAAKPIAQDFSSNEKKNNKPGSRYESRAAALKSLAQNK